MTAPTRPVLRWHGGKWRLAPWIIGHMPEHRVFVEPFGGAASVLLRKPRAYAEVYNDLDGDVVDLFRVLRDPAFAARLQELLRLTPFARAEFELAYSPCEDVLERARRLVVRSYMGFGANAHAAEARGHRSTGFRATSPRRRTTGPTIPTPSRMRAESFLHRSLKPLAEVDLSTAEERGQGMLIVCDAGCGL